MQNPINQVNNDRKSGNIKAIVSRKHSIECDLFQECKHTHTTIGTERECTDHGRQRQTADRWVSAVVVASRRGSQTTGRSSVTSTSPARINRRCTLINGLPDWHAESTQNRRHVREKKSSAQQGSLHLPTPSTKIQGNYRVNRSIQVIVRRMHLWFTLHILSPVLGIRFHQATKETAASVCRCDWKQNQRGAADNVRTWRRERND